MTSARDLPLVKIIATGGTIANTAAGRAPFERILEDVPEASKHARFEVEEVSRTGANAFTPENWLQISRAVDRALRTQPELAAVIVPHGTFTAEETAYFLNPLPPWGRTPSGSTARQSSTNEL